jgi:hypothetical protein
MDLAIPVLQCYAPEATAHIEIILQEKAQVVIGGLLQRLHLLLMKPASILLCFLLIVGWCASGSTQARTFRSDPLARSTQTIVVTTTNWNAVEGQLQRYERATANEKWRPVGEPISVVVGKNGIGWGIGVLATDDPNFRVSSDPVKREGDGKSPAGVFALGTAFGYASQTLPGSKMPYLSPALTCGNISTVQVLRTSHSGLGTVSNPYSRSATTPWG